MIKVNTDKTTMNKFIKGANDGDSKPIWYYKKLYEVDVDYVIAYLLHESFVVEIDGIKHEITFGLNKKENYIGQTIFYNDIKNSNLCSYEVIRKGFTEGKWFIIAEEDTSEEFKADYRSREESYKKEQTREMNIGIITNAIRQLKDLDEDDKKKYIEELHHKTDDELNSLIKVIFERLS